MNIDQLSEIASNSEHHSFGLRRMNGVKSASVGSLVSNSFEWVDGESTGNELDGACVIRLDFDGWEFCKKNMNKMIDLMGQYDGELVLIGGDSLYEGNDPYESIFKNAEIVAKI